MKYYLLTFRAKYKHHDIFAAKLFNEEEYNEWLKLPTYIKNDNYKKEYEEYKNNNSLFKIGPSKYKKHIVQYEGRGVYLCEENMCKLVINNVVISQVVTEEFYNTFKTNIEKHNNCNIFDLKL